MDLFEQQDADLFASWGVDYLKEDWCNIPFSSFPGQSHQQPHDGAAQHYIGVEIQSRLQFAESAAYRTPY